MIRVCHLTTGLEIGGAEINLANLVARMDKARFSQHVISMIEPGPVAARIKSAGVPLSSLGMKRGRAGIGDLLRAMRALRSERPDIVQCWMYHADLLGLLAGRLAGVKRVVWNLRCTDMRSALASARLLRLLARVSSWPDAVIVNSEAGRALHAQLGYRPRRFVLIANGVDTERFQPRLSERETLRQALGLSREARAVALVARLHPMKDHASFIAAASRVAARRPEAVFFFIGEGCTDASPMLRALIGGAGLQARVRLLGPRLDMERLYPALDAVALSSLYGEGFPTVLIEALASGVPCVATDVGDSARIVGPAGVIVPPNDAEALAQGIEAVLARGRDAYCAEARARADAQFGLEPMTRAYETLYEELMSVPKAGLSYARAG
jgi:glycosyltransferase involved in cell wall biosynthesis